MRKVDRFLNRPSAQIGMHAIKNYVIPFFQGIGSTTANMRIAQYFRLADQARTRKISDVLFELIFG